MAVPPPGSAVAICNLALARLGQKPITSIETPTGANADLCALHYPMTRRALLRGPRVYNFAKKYARLTKSATEIPAFGFASAFALPNNFLRLLGIGDVTINNDTPAGLYDLVNGFIYTDERDGVGINVDTINFYYIFDEI